MSNECDALVARVWEAIGTYSVQVATTGELAPSTALREAIEALAAQPAGAVGEAPKGGVVDEALPDFLERVAAELVRRDTLGGTFAPGVAMSLRGRAHVLRRVESLDTPRAEQENQNG